MENPNFDLPGLGYFHQNPGGAPFSVGPRITRFLTSGVISVPLSATQVIAVPFTALVNDFRAISDAVWIEDFWCTFIPADTSGQLQLTSGLMNLFGNPTGGTGFGYDLGIFVLTLASPRSAVVAIRDSQKLITGQDMAAMLAFSPGKDNNLSITAQIQVHNNDAAAAHSATVNFTGIFRLMHGLYE